MKTDLDPALYDIGSGLACSYDNINYYLKGVYFKKGDLGFVEFTKLDKKWISYLFSVNFKVKIETKTTTSTTVTIKTGGSSYVEKPLYGLFYKKSNGVFGECPYNAQRKFVSIF